MSLPRHFENKFEIFHKISEGGMGAVYKVRHQLLDQIQVIKVIRPQHEDNEDLRRRFQREAKTAMRMRHRNIAAMHDFSIGEGGTAYIVMEYIDGRTLRDLLKESDGLPLDLVMEIARQSLEALDYLHRQGYVHRDISPDNLMLTRDTDGTALVKLIDLGVAKQVGGGRDLTATGMFVGKARYSSPEQLGGKETDQRSDVYSFGVMLYQLLTGSVPVDGTDISSLVAGHLFRPPIPFAESDPEGRVPKGLRRVVLQTLEKDPQKRIASAAELSRLLVPFQAQIEATIQTPLESLPIPGGAPKASEAAVAATSVSRPRDARHRSWHRPLLAAAGTVGVLAILATGWWRLSRAPAAVPQWETQYHDALDAIEAGELSGVPGLLRRARDAQPSAAANPRWSAPGRRGPYLPYYFLGEAYFLQNNCVEALDAWRESERQGVVQSTPFYVELQASRAHCEALFNEAVERLERVLERGAELEVLLRNAIDNPAFQSIWDTDPELSQRIAAAVEAFDDLRTRFAAARDGGGLGAVLVLESEILAAEEDLGELVDQVVTLTG